MSSRSSSLFLVAIVVVLLAASPRAACAGDRDHLGGVFLRLSAGFGTASTETSASGVAFGLSGMTGDVNLAIGGMVAPHLALHGTLFGWMVDDPEFEIGGISVDAHADLDLNAIGGGLTYYFMPVNIYVSGSLGAGTLAIEGPGGEGETDTGVVLDLTAGKEWWVGNRWGIGIAGAFGYHDVPEEGLPNNWSGTSFAIRFTATMN